ncbi:MAG: sulfotransferase [Bacteroidales bacterium]|nr:sulfotransferase [Bacteroidales bacterium]
MARSGSTLLARELDTLEDVAVGIEEDIPDGLVEGRKVKLNNEADLKIYVDRIFQGKKLRAWNVNKNALMEKIHSNNEFPIYYDSILKALLSLYFQDNSASHIIHKKGSYHLKIDRVRELFPDSKFIHVGRDPRGIYNSQKKARDSTTGSPMSIRILTFCFQYKHSWNMVGKHKDRDYFRLVRYEDLIDNKAGEIDNLLKYIGVKNAQYTESNDYFTRIPESQKSLHANVSRDMLVGRKDAWKHELRPYEIYILQKALKKEMREGGYAKEKLGFFKIDRKWFVVRKLMVFHVKNGLKTCFPQFYNKLKRLINSNFKHDEM